MIKIRHNLKVAQARKKSYADKNKTYSGFKVHEHLFLKVKDKRSLLRLGSYLKLVVRYCGPYEVLEKIGLVAYMLALLASMRIQNVFHVSLLKKYVPNPNCIIHWTVIQVEHEGDFQVEPVCILD
jgi:hypothetical protein